MCVVLDKQFSGHLPSGVHRPSGVPTPVLTFTLSLALDRRCWHRMVTARANHILLSFLQRPLQKLSADFPSSTWSSNVFIGLPLFLFWSSLKRSLFTISIFFCLAMCPRQFACIRLTQSKTYSVPYISKILLFDNTNC